MVFFETSIKPHKVDQRRWKLVLGCGHFVLLIPSYSSSKHARHTSYAAGECAVSDSGEDYTSSPELTPHF